MSAVIVLGILVGLDNLQVGSALGLAGLRAGRRWAAAGLFALCETVMPLLGLVLGHAVRRAAGEVAEVVGVVALALCGALILWLSASDDGAAEVVNSTAALVGLPVSLSFDNLVAGIGLGSLGYPPIASALVIGSLSGGLCALGLFCGAWIRRFVPRRAEALAGLFLIAMAAYRALEELA